MKLSFGTSFKMSLFCVLVCFGTLPSAGADTKKVHTYPGIVRLSYVQGDVRLSPGDGKTPDLTKPWQRAEVNVPVLKGYGIATGNGRAEVEFEYGSEIYLAENSVLLFQTLTTKGGVPSTEVELVTGTATVSFRPIPQESFIVTSPTETMQLVQPGLVQVDSFLDGATVTIHGNGWDDVMQGHLGFVVYRQRLAPGERRPGDQSNVPAGWDAWVAERVKQRNTDAAAALKASGMSSLTPGLIDLYKGGTFFPCAPFGTCWEPKDLSGTTGEISAPETVTPSGVDASTNGTNAMDARVQVLPQPAQAAAQTETQQASQQSGARRNTPTTADIQRQGGALVAGTAARVKKQKLFSTSYYPYGECPPTQLRVVTRSDPATGRKTLIEQTEIPAAAPWSWALCYSGAWVHLRRHRTQYTFCVGKKRHRPPVRWVHTQKGDAYVPRHPSDVKGKPPLNLKYGVFLAQKSSAGAFEFLNFGSAEKYKILSEAPKEFRNLKAPQLPVADRPPIQGRLMVAPASGTKSLPGKIATIASTAITYDYKTRNFVQAGTPIPGRTSRPVTVGRLSTHGGYSTRSGGNTGGGNRGNGGSRVAANGNNGKSGSGGPRAGGARSGGGGASRGSSGGSQPRPSSPNPRQPR